MKRKIAIRATVGVVVCGVVVGSYFVGKGGSEVVREEGDVEITTSVVETEEMFTIKFDSRGGSSVESQTVARGCKVLEPEIPRKSCECEFDGWYIGDEKWSFTGYVVTEDITLTARWVDCFGLNSKEMEILKFYVGRYGDGTRTWRDVSDVVCSECTRVNSYGEVELWEGLLEYKIIYKDGKTQTVRLGDEYKKGE